jgi:hypothetical protein
MGVRIDPRLYRSFCTVLAVAFFFSNFANYSEKWGLQPLYWIMVLGVISARAARCPSIVPEWSPVGMKAMAPV